ncbi:DUF6894 family protein [Sphingomonas sp. Tas61C01]|uniref:DUF6894 family protein n=1 Tax=Sphingomonas sp. Tas61C01 TaxID=3458297 RepID=UPI00403E5DD2
MPRFFFHLHDCGNFTPDEEGRELADMDAAVAVALHEARELLAAEIAEGKLCLGCRIEVVEEHSDRAMIVPFSSTVQIESAVVEKPPAV